MPEAYPIFPEEASLSDQRRGISPFFRTFGKRAASYGGKLFCPYGRSIWHGRTTIPCSGGSSKVPPKRSSSPTGTGSSVPGMAGERGSLGTAPRGGGGGGSATTPRREWGGGPGRGW